MLKVLKSLTRTSGGTIPPNAILTYQVVTQPKSAEIQITFLMYYNAEAMKTGKKPVPIGDVKEFQLPDGTQVQGGKYTPNDSILVGLTPMTFVNITDTIAKAYVEEAFLGENSIEKIGAELPE